MSTLHEDENLGHSSDSRIPKEDAMKFINYYQQDLPQDDLKSVWIGKDVINFILLHGLTQKIDGIRVYLAKYDGVTGRSGTEPEKFPKGKITTILALTTLKDNVHENINNGFFNYGHPCPPDCGVTG